MAMISCECGYRGAGISDGAALVCPICRTPVAAAPAPRPAPAAAPPPAPPPFAAPPPPPTGGLRMPPPPGGRAAAQEPRPPEPAARPAPTSGVAAAGGSGVLRIPCPNGHVLKTKRSMLGQQVVCPSCNEFFVLEETESLEYKKEEERRRAKEDEERAQKWLWRAIYSAIFIVLSFLVMAIISANPQWFR